MKIDTTLNVKTEVLERIDSVASRFSITRSRVVSLLCKQLLSRHRTDKNRFSRVKYQKRDKNASWKRPHVVMDYDLYEKCIDLRKLNKMSVSYLVTVAVTLFLDELIDRLRRGDGEDADLRHYIFVGSRKGNVFSYTVFWDFPPEEELIKILE